MLDGLIDPRTLIKVGTPDIAYDRDREVFVTYIQGTLDILPDDQAELQELAEIVVGGMELPGIDPTVTSVDLVVLTEDTEYGTEAELRCIIEVTSDRLQPPDLWGRLCWMSDALDHHLGLSF